MSWNGNVQRADGDPIDASDHDLLVDALDNFFGAQNGSSSTPLDATLLPQPFQVSKPSLLLLEAEGQATPDFPSSVTVYLSPDGVIYTERASASFLFMDILEARTLLVPIPKGWFFSFTAPYGFIKSGLLF